MPILLRTTQIRLILFRISRNGPDEACGEMQDPMRGPALISLSKVLPLVLTLSNGFSRNLQRWVVGSGDGAG